MSIAFSGSELINIAINIEKCGIAFYDIMSKSTEKSACAVFRYLADMERQHAKIFQDMLAGADKTKPPDSNDEEYQGYLQALVNSAVFTDEMTTSELANRVSSDIEAFELGIEAEKDSILFYYEMRDVMPPRAQPTVSRIIGEEKSHLRQLTELKKKLTEPKR